MKTFNDFKEFWEDAEFFGGEGSMDAAELAWDYQQEKIDALEKRLNEASWNGEVDRHGGAFTDQELLDVHNNNW